MAHDLNNSGKFRGFKISVRYDVDRLGLKVELWSGWWSDGEQQQFCLRKEVDRGQKKSD